MVGQRRKSDTCVGDGVYELVGCESTVAARAMQMQVDIERWVFGDGLKAAEAALPALELHDRLREVCAGEFGPIRVGHPELRVRDLIQKEIR